MKQTSFAIGALFLLAGCPAPLVETQPVSVELEPMPVPGALALGDTEVWEEDGELVTYVVTSAENGVFRIEGSQGCSYDHSPEQRFAPTSAWFGCDGSTGTQTRTRTGNIFPLAVGNTEAWAYSGENNNGETWDGTRSCEVTGTARITVPMGTYDTYHVICRDENRVREWYLAPELGGSAIAFQRRHLRRNEITNMKLVSMTPGG